MAQAKQREASTRADNWKGFGLTLGALSLRSIVEYGLLAFIPLFMMGVLGQPEAVSSVTISAFAIAAALATAMSGRTSECVGAVRLQRICFAATAVLIVVFALSTNVVAAFCFAMLLAIATDLFYASTVAYGMDCVPNSLGMASGLSYGVAICVGGVAEPFLGMAADAIGLAPVLLILAGVAALGFLLSLFMRQSADELTAKDATEISDFKRKGSAE